MPVVREKLRLNGTQYAIKLLVSLVKVKIYNFLQFLIPQLSFF